MTSGSKAAKGHRAESGLANRGRSVGRQVGGRWQKKGGTAERQVKTVGIQRKSIK